MVPCREARTPWSHDARAHDRLPPLPTDRPDRRGALLRRADVSPSSLVSGRVLAGGAASCRAAPGRLRRPSGPRPLEETASVVDELTLKADLAADSTYAPEVIILGGSRSLRFEPEYIERKTGHSAFNAGVRNGRPEEAWGLTHYLHDLYPDVRPRYLWLIHVNILRGWERVSAPLVRDARFCRYFPQSFLDEQEAEPAAARRRGQPRRPPEWAADGHLDWSPLTTRPAGDGHPRDDLAVAGAQRPPEADRRSRAPPSGSKRRWAT